MGKPTSKKKKSVSIKSNGDNSKSSRSTEHSRKVFDEDAPIFVSMAHDFKEEGNKLFQKRNYDGALVSYEKAIKLLPKNHVDIPHLHSNIAACYMQMEPLEYHKAIHQCNLALDLSPNYTKALLKRARCFEAMNRLDSASRDVDAVLRLEPNNLTAIEVSEKIKQAIEAKGIQLADKEVVSPPKITPPVGEKSRGKKSNKTMGKGVVEEKIVSEKSVGVKEEAMKAVKLVFGEDIRFVQIPGNCSMSRLSEIVQNRFPSLKEVLIKYKDREGDLVTITTSEELKWAEDDADPQGSVRLYVIEVKSEHEPLFDDENKRSEVQNSERNLNGEEERDLCCINEWIVEFAQLFKNHVGIDSDAYLDLHQLGMKLYSEAMEETVTSEEAMEVFELASVKFQEMAALALFNRGNVHMSRARKRVFYVKNNSKEAEFAQVKSTYEWAKGEYKKAGSSYEEAIKIKPDFYEGLLALAHQQLEEAKLTWRFAIGSKEDVLEYFDNAEEYMERGTEIWEEIEEEHSKARIKPNREKVILENLGLGLFSKQFSADETAENFVNMRSQVHVLWGRILYERSIVEFKLSLPTWEDCLMTAVEKFKLAGASPTDISVVIKSHCANHTTQEGLGFKIDEIIQAWNEMYDAKRWMCSVPSFRLEPLFRRRVPKILHSLEHA
ncbi:hypothetical protein KSP40_PGU013804 [Platanthera guangdongensis]|uniref:PB1 domain-containing protein n=1 Tax=Platanthera guangdongensis TaxID=2320717 RepID=A0ABR2M7Z6_9ASPA